MTTERKYPIGIQTFSEIIRGGYLYIDKTDLVWQLAHYAKYIFLSRPRRFGKSLLSSTLHSYFAGDRELFEGLKIMELEQEWESYPVLHFDLSGAKHMPVKGVREELSRLLDDMEKVWGANPRETSPGMRFAGLVNRAYEQTGRQVAVIIDEYDAPLLDVLHEDETLKDMREVMQEFYQRLKMLEPKIKFCFITGITKFSQLSIFSTINNLTNVTMDSMFASICGITEKELTTTLKPDIERLACLTKMTFNEMQQKLKLQYDGYRFVEDSEEIYNPFSLLKAFQQRKVASYWFESGTPTFLIRQLQHFRTDITVMDDMEEPVDAYMASIPYVEGFKKKLEESARDEGFYKYTFYLIFSMLNVYIRTQVKCSKGRADMVVWMPDAIYVMELKVNDTAESALRQIDEKGYAKPFATDGRKIVKIGIKFSPETMTVEDWAIEA